ncbi:MAG: CDP-diacylglycerol--glycerol-3-phosphate 3-phosphatidyltransferase [Firmicutes bacterium]|nr:CDP-diacylglycerol--glycerol-3-phosphate 3-phosphatidyltransferase [Bacillota bacterium]
MNIPNTLTILRVICVPIFVVVMMLDIAEPWAGIISAVIFGLVSLTDMLDGKIARKYNMITDFGKVADPVADKFMVFSALITMLIVDRYAFMKNVLIWATLIVILRELAVTSIRIVVAGKAPTLAANMLGKVKTVSQIVFILAAFLEPSVYAIFGAEDTLHIVTYVTMAFMVVMTVVSGVNYLKVYGKYMDKNI